MLLGWLLLGCAAPDAPPAQPPIQAMLAAHVEPLPRNETGCDSPGYTRCGTVMGPPFQRRTQNLTWLLETWVAHDRTVEVLLGPEASLAWTGDPTVRGWVADELGEARAEELSEEVLAALEAARDAERLSLGVHLHTVVRDGSGLLGVGPLVDEHGGTRPCDAWAGDPVAAGDPEVTAAVLSLGIGAAEQIAERLSTPLVAISSHVPRAIDEKVAVVAQPSVWGGEWFQPTSLSKGYSECFQQAVDHPPFEGYRTDGETALGVGAGPLVLPGERSLGSMAVHLDEDSDASLGAARRRLLQLLLNRRHAALAGQAARPWLYTFFTHDYQLNPDYGEPPARDEVLALEGHAYRADVLGIAEDIDALAELDGWLGDAGPVAVWRRAEELDATGSQFSYGEAGAPPLEGLDPEAYPYLPLVGERLADTHLICADTVAGVAVFELLRCAGGWGWGEGFSCAGAPEAVWVLVPAEAGDACLDVEGGALRAGAVDAEALGAARWCAGGGLAVPREGLIVEPGDAQWWSAGCGE